MGPERFAYVPSLAWLGSSDLALRATCATGALIAGLLLVDLAPAWCALALYVLYLSIVSVGGDFLSFQWDSLLLEVGLLAVLYAPWRLRRAPPRREPTRIGRWLLWWLAFRLMFASGVVKLASGDATWRGLDALAYHYQTQPLPTPIAWYAHHLPPWFQQASVLVMFAIEIGAAFLVFLPRRLRHLACGLFVLFQVLIAATGNYGMFNLLSVALFATLLDDAFLLRLLPARLRGRLRSSAPRPREAPSKLLLAAPLALLVAAVSGGLTADLRRRAAGRPPLDGLARSVVVRAAPLRSVNPYGLFAVMTTERPEIEIEGERGDGTWVAYRFRWKSGPLDRPPPWVAPHMPRLDWQMWFAALGGARQERWFRTLLGRLLEGEPAVLDLLESSPFPDSPPRRVRARLYLYEFTTPAERAASGGWWKREWLRDVVPPVSLGG
ncbi:MAG TPA: lipase maturation factor family protein [Planctomycetota bacterium]|nr:lipase maturation factor family protein [Planctomycetota bacterium]